MIATLYLLGCVLVPAQTAPEPAPGDGRLQPHLARSQELFYRGTYGEENVGERTRYTRSFRVETRVFVLDAAAKETELGRFHANHGTDEFLAKFVEDLCPDGGRVGPGLVQKRDQARAAKSGKDQTANQPFAPGH